MKRYLLSIGLGALLIQAPEVFRSDLGALLDQALEVFRSSPGALLVQVLECLDQSLEPSRFRSWSPTY